MPIYQTSTYAQSEVGVHKGYDYSRTANPTRAALEGLPGVARRRPLGLAFATGMAAEDTLLHLLEPGDHVVASRRRVRRHVPAVPARAGARRAALHLCRRDALEESRRDRSQTRLIWLESPTNPLMKLIDIAAVAAAAHARGILVAVDNTFASPYCQRPLELGADVVHYSTTKYLGGHSDVVGGALVTSDDGPV